MSRNLCRTDCYFCHGDVLLVGTVAPITPTQSRPVYYDDYAGMLVADAECQDCEAKYLAWVDESTRKANGWNRGRDDRPFVDLSFRSTFNDEPGDDDLPKYNVKETVIRERTGPYDGPYARRDGKG